MNNPTLHPFQNMIITASIPMSQPSPKYVIHFQRCGIGEKSWLKNKKTCSFPHINKATIQMENQTIKKIETLFLCIEANVVTFVQNLNLRTLYLMRHGHALSAEMGQADYARKLSEKGEADIAHEAQILLNKSISFDLVLCSPTERTQKTAGILVHGMGLKHEIIEFETRLVNASPDQIFFCIMEANPDSNHLLVVAHNPGISNLAGMLSTQTPILSFQPGGIAAFQYPEARSWMEAAQQEPEFLWYVQP